MPSPTPKVKDQARPKIRLLPTPPKDLKQIIVCKKAAAGPDCDGQIPPIVLDVPKADTPKPALDKHESVRRRKRNRSR